MFILFFAFQILKCMDLFSVNIPANSVIAITEAKKTVDCQLFSWKHMKILWAAIFGGSEDTVDTFLQRYEKYTRMQ